MEVTPHAGVWIEIAHMENKTVKTFVTPHAGVWIEIIPAYQLYQEIKSLPMRECGLKSLLVYRIIMIVVVTPHAGVWIEMLSSNGLLFLLSGHSPCGSVD